jgi:hypothetical protein
MNLNPANCKGLVYCNPIFIPAKAVDHKTQAVSANRILLLSPEIEIIYWFDNEFANVDRIIENKVVKLFT